MVILLFKFFVFPQIPEGAKWLSA